MNFPGNLYLRLHASNAGVADSIPDQGIRSLMPFGKKKEKKRKKMADGDEAAISHRKVLGASVRRGLKGMKKLAMQVSEDKCSKQRKQ